jgi:transposase
VLSLDEKTQIQALDRTQPPLPIEFDRSEQRTHDYVRHGTTNLFAALNVKTGELIGDCLPARNGPAFLAFLTKAVAPHAGLEIHVVLDNLSTHTTPDVRAWLDAHPNIHFHFTPTGSSWLNQIETWFGINTRQAVRRGTFASVQILIRTIRAYIASWNTNPRPFQWTATTDEILAKVRLIEHHRSRNRPPAQHRSHRLTPQSGHRQRLHRVTRHHLAWSRSRSLPRMASR